MKVQRLMWASAPLFAIGIASLASAIPATPHPLLGAWLNTDQAVPQGATMFDCAEPAGQRHPIQAIASPRVRCPEHQNHQVFPPKSISNAQAGTTMNIQYDNTSGGANSTCPVFGRHSPSLQSIWTNPDGIGQSGKTYATGVESTCWASDLNAGTCVGQTAVVTIFSSVGQRGVCANHQFQAVSLGQN